MVELVVEVRGPPFDSEPAVREMRRALEASVVSNVRLGMAVAQEFGRLCVTLRALVQSADLLDAARLGAPALREVLTDTSARFAGRGVRLDEVSLHTSWS